MFIPEIRAAISAAGATPASYQPIDAMRELVAAYGGTPTQYTHEGLLREAITALGGTPTQVAYLPLLRELVTAAGLTPLTYSAKALWDQIGFSAALVFAGGERGAWWDIQDLTSMFQDSAGTTPAAVDSPVGKINDKSGNGHHLTQSTSASQPMLRNDGTRYYLEFDGVDDFLSAGDVLDLLTGGYFGVIALRVTSATATQVFYAKRRIGNNYYGAAKAVVGTDVLVAADHLAAGTNAQIFTVHPMGADEVVSFRFHRQTPDHRIKVRRTGVSWRSNAWAGETTNMDHATRFLVGCRGNAADDTTQEIFFGGRLYGLVLKMEMAANETHLQQLEDYLGGVSGVPAP